MFEFMGRFIYMYIIFEQMSIHILSLSHQGEVFLCVNLLVSEETVYENNASFLLFVTFAF